MSVIRAAVLAVSMLLVAVVPHALGEPDGKKPAAAKERKPKFTVGKETTYVTGPLDKDGYIDYEAALNDRLAAGVTPTTNAYVLLAKALGPHPEGATLPPEFWQRLAIPQPPEEGEYFVDLFRYLKEQLKIDTEQRREEIDRALELATQRPWTSKQFPNLASWLKANEKPLMLVAQAGKRSQYFAPLISRRTDKGTSGLFAVHMPGVQQCRALASALIARALLHVGETRYDDAWKDLLACHRLGRVVARGGTLIETLVGMAIDRLACNADLAFLENPDLDARRIKDSLRDLQALPPLAPVVDKLEISERFAALETFMMLDRYGIKYLELLSGGRQSDALHPLAERVLEDVDWDPALRNANRWYDRLAAAVRPKERVARTKQLEQIDRDVKALRVKLTDEGGMTGLLLGKGADKGQVVGDMVIVLILPAAAKVQGAADREEQTLRNLHLAFALALYQREHGKYPERLDVLTPAYLPQAPQDLFSDAPLIYRPAAKGYLLYSVGPNGKDEGGRGSDDSPRGDDLRVQMPLPPLPRR